MGDNHKCYTMEAKRFEDLLNKKGISYSDFVELRKAHEELSIGGKAEVADRLTIYEEE